MSGFLTLIVLLFAASTASAQPQFIHEKMVDLTHPLVQGMPQFSAEAPFSIHKLSGYESGYFSNAITLPEHIGTHVDAPAHFCPSRRQMADIPITDFVGYAVVIDVTDEGRKDPDYALTIEGLKKWELKHGPIKKNSIVLLRTGWEEKWSRPREYVNRDRQGTPHFPGFSCETVDYLAHNRLVRALGTDTLSIDPGRSEDFCVHKILLQANKYALEGLTNLKKLPPHGATIVVSPLKIEGGSGSPARVFAWLP